MDLCASIMTLLHLSTRFPIRPLSAPRPPPCFRHSSRFSVVRFSLPFPPEKSQYYKEVEAAVDAVEKACRLCVDVKMSLFSNDSRVLEKDDRTPVTIADFGVQALISLELGRLFPSIPLVAEEDSACLRSNFEGDEDNCVVNSVLSSVADKASCGGKPLTSDDVLDAVDRGGKAAFSFDSKPTTYWVLDPIDGTRGFLKGSGALYVVGLALVVEGNIAIGVMGCPNWKEDLLSTKNNGNNEIKENKSGTSGHGVIMIAHIGCGTWARKLSDMQDEIARAHYDWTKCSVDKCCLVHEAIFCISDSQTWESLPLSILFSSTIDAGRVPDKQEVLLLQTCCGSLCKYLMVASGRASVFILRAKDQTVIKAWDHAVGMICVEEAGGQVTDWRGSSLDLAADHIERRIIFPSGGVLVTNGTIHKHILDMISSNLTLV